MNKIVIINSIEQYDYIIKKYDIEISDLEHIQNIHSLKYSMGNKSLMYLKRKVNICCDCRDCNIFHDENANINFMCFYAREYGIITFQDLIRKEKFKILLDE